MRRRMSTPMGWMASSSYPGGPSSLQVEGEHPESAMSAGLEERVRCPFIADEFAGVHIRALWTGEMTYSTQRRFGP